MNKKELVVETIAELFTAAFAAEGVLKTPDSLAIESTPRTDGRVDPDALWFKQTFEGLPNLDLFVGIPRDTHEAMSGRATAPGYDDEELPFRVQMERIFHAFARTLSTAVGLGISCVSFVQEFPEPGTRTISLVLRQSACKIFVALTEAAISSLARRIPFGGAPESVRRDPYSHRPGSFEPSRLDVLMNINLPVSISFGSVEMALGDVLKLATGSIVELDHLLNEPINVVVNNCLIARGEVVVAEGNYAIRVSEVVSPGNTA